MTGYLRKLIAFLIVLAGFSLLSQPLFAEEIEVFRSRINVETSGVIRVVEDITYDFGTESRHGIFRDILYIKKNQEGRRYQMDVDVVSVTDENGVAYPFSTSQLNGTHLRVKIGDPDAFVTGKKNYSIIYTVGGAISYFSDHDELYWNITGNEWQIPVGSALYEISLPANTAGSLNATCYSGPVGSSAKDCEVATSGARVTGGTTAQLQASEGVTVAISFPPNIVAHLEPKEVVDFFSTFWGKIVLGIMAVVGFVWYFGLPIAIPFYWFKNGRDPKAQIGETRAWFDPPSNKNGQPLGPGETGLLVDETVDMKDIFGVVIDLARRGYFKIVEAKKGDFHLIKGDKDTADLKIYEQALMEGFFKTKTDVRLKDADLIKTVSMVKDDLYRIMTAEGFFPRNPETIRTIWIGVSIAALMTGNFLLAAVGFLFGRAMPKKTAFGAGQANVGKSLKNFLSTQERQLEFQAKNQMFFEKLLPFAIAFGVEKVWADRFKDINLQPPQWYSGYDNRAFTTAHFLSSMNSSFSTFRTSATPTSSSSGFSSGFSGGSSGGGGGGGGGGSW